MSSSSRNDRCERRDLVPSYALAALDSNETELMAAHLPTCAECQQEYYSLGALAGALTAWRTQTLPPPAPLWNSLAERIANLPQKKSAVPPAPQVAWSGAQDWQEPQWQEAAPGITCKLLSTDTESDRVSMLVRLAPGVAYPPHRHAGVEELYLLEGELWIEDRKLYPGDYNRAEPGTADQRVYSETGCMCLLITSPSDQLR
ncbi:MAG TPA: cupin domain-containing protein [Steroidobacter sp.]|uniref:cupin domain-containing protein n=1 Tax=Steroidobacter sp. TaxID=1978227 RepID=UPI002EDA43C6